MIFVRKEFHAWRLFLGLGRICGGRRRKNRMRRRRIRRSWSLLLVLEDRLDAGNLWLRTLRRRRRRCRRSGSRGSKARCLRRKKNRKIYFGREGRSWVGEVSQTFFSRKEGESFDSAKYIRLGSCWSTLGRPDVALCWNFAKKKYLRFVLHVCRQIAHNGPFQMPLKF